VPREEELTMPEALSSMTVIGPDTQIKGELTFDTAARILGRVEGKVTSKGELQIGETAVCKAALDAGKVTIDGTVEGNVSARERVQLNGKARVTGDISALTLVVAEGASFVGHCRVGPEAGRSAVTAAPETIARTTRSSNRNGTPTVVIAGHPQPIAQAPDNLAAAFAGLEAKLAGIGKQRALETAADVAA